MLQSASPQSWPLLDALERTADPALWDEYVAARSEWETARTPIPSGPGSFIHKSPLTIESIRRRANDAFEQIRSNFRELLFNERLTACGSRNGPSEPPTPISALGWRSLVWPKLQNSTVKERFGAKSKIFNVRISPILHSDRAPTLLNGLSLTDAFRKCVIEDPEVVALGKRVIARCGHRDVFEEGQAPGPFVDFHWSLGLSADEIASNFVYLIAWNESTRFPEPSPQIVNASAALADRCQALRRILSSGQIAASGTFAQTGMTGLVGRMQWQRSGVTVEIRNGDLCEAENHRPVVRWSGITLELPNTTVLSHTTDVPAVSATPPSTESAVTFEEMRTTAVRESIIEAVQALWPDGPPRSLQLQQRDDQIIEWQRKNKRKVVSQKSIRRYLPRDGRILSTIV